MCDEYDDERMRAFWRQLALQDELEKLEREPDVVDEAIVMPVRADVEPKRTKPQALRH